MSPTKAKKAVSAVAVGSTVVPPVTVIGSSTPTAVATITSGLSASTADGTVVAPRPGFREDLQEMLQGYESVMADGSTLPSAAVAGGLTKATVVSELQQLLGLFTAVDTQVAGTRAARLSLSDALPQGRALYSVLKAAVTGFFGPGSPTLAQFGLTPKTARAKASGQALAARAVRAAGTRDIRGTLGSAERKKAPRFTGTVTPAGAASAVSGGTAAPVATPVVAAPVAVPAAPVVAPAAVQAAAVPVAGATSTSTSS